MGRTVSIGNQDFESIRSKNCFYIDKTEFIRQWWDSEDTVTLITRPRRFGKTLNMSMLECFFSDRYSGRGDLFEDLTIWNYEDYRKLQGTYPVISLTFAAIKSADFEAMKGTLNWILSEVYSRFHFLLEGDILTENDKAFFRSVSTEMPAETAVRSLHMLSKFLSSYYGKKVIILLDEYDTPMQEAYVYGYWDEAVQLFRNLFNASFKTNPYLGRAVMTGITRVSRESLFSDFNNLNVVTTTSEEYASAFGFTEGEVFAAMDEMGLTEKEKVKQWYDGFTIGKVTDIYNPWSITNYLKKGEFATYWANTSSNGLAGKLIREGNPDIKKDFETLLRGEVLETKIDEQIVFGELDADPSAVWSLLLASGYLKVITADVEKGSYALKLTNYEVKQMFEKLVSGWFRRDSWNYNEFIKALLRDDIEVMNIFMNRVAISTFSYFDTAKGAGAENEPERFYHGFVLGLMVDLRDRYVITSNRESGFGRYDILLEPLDKEADDGILMEFKVLDRRRESSLSETVAAALKQIEEKNYAQTLIDRGVSPQRIRRYGFAFEGKTVEIG